MFWSVNEGDGVRCNYHGWKFDATGACMEAGGGYGSDTRAFRTHEQDGLVWAYLGYEEELPEVPSAPWGTAAITQQRRGKPYIECLAESIATYGPDRFSSPFMISHTNGDGWTLLAPADDRNTVNFTAGNSEPVEPPSTDAIASAKAVAEQILSENIVPA
jgi:hypothetical protein